VMSELQAHRCIIPESGAGSWVGDWGDRPP